MAIEGTLQGILAALVGGRCYPIANTTSPVTLPYITFQVTGNEPASVLSSPNELSKRRVQIDVFAASYNAVKTLEQSVNTAMKAATFANVRTFAFDEYVDEIETYREVLEYTIWSA